jgi:hypothetical protein
MPPRQTDRGGGERAQRKYGELKAREGGGDADDSASMEDAHQTDRRGGGGGGTQRKYGELKAREGGGDADDGAGMEDAHHDPQQRKPPAIEDEPHDVGGGPCRQCIFFCFFFRQTVLLTMPKPIRRSRFVREDLPEHRLMNQQFMLHVLRASSTRCFVVACTDLDKVTTETNRIQLVLFGIQNRALGPCSAANSRIFISGVKNQWYTKACRAMPHKQLTITEG